MNFCGECGRRTTELTRSDRIPIADTVCSGCFAKVEDCRCLPVDYDPPDDGRRALLDEYALAVHERDYFKAELARKIADPQAVKGSSQYQLATLGLTSTDISNLP